VKIGSLAFGHDHPFPNRSLQSIASYITPKCKRFIFGFIIYPLPSTHMKYIFVVIMQISFLSTDFGQFDQGFREYSIGGFQNGRRCTECTSGIDIKHNPLRILSNTMSRLRENPSRRRRTCRLQQPVIHNTTQPLSLPSSLNTA
jgi:hypothetical protein